MLYLVASRISLISGANGNKYFRVFFVGTICYLILHAILYSNYGDQSELIKNYRSYLYYLWGIDLIITGLIMKLFSSSDEHEIETEIIETDACANESNDIKSEQTKDMDTDSVIKRKSDAIFAKTDNAPPKQENNTDTDIPLLEANK